MILAKLTADVQVDDELIITKGTAVEIEDMNIPNVNSDSGVIGIRFRNKSYVIPIEKVLLMPCNDNSTPVIDAIPIAWLKHMQRATTLARTSNSITDVLNLWERMGQYEEGNNHMPNASLHPGLFTPKEVQMKMVEFGQQDTGRFKLGEIIRYDPYEVRKILEGTLQKI